MESTKNITVRVMMRWSQQTILTARVMMRWSQQTIITVRSHDEMESTNNNYS